MTEKVTIIITTYKRPEKLRECIESIRKFTNPDLYNLSIMIDNKDYETSNLVQSNKWFKYSLADKKMDWVGLTNHAVECCETELFLFICDDWLAVEEGWLEKGVKAFKEKFPDGAGLLIFNDFIQEEYKNIVRPIKLKDGTEIKMATHGLSTKKFVKELGGELLYHGYRHYSADCELAIKAHQLGKYYYLKDVMLKHNHHIHTGEKDEVYNDSERLNFQRDQALFIMRNGSLLA